jgi:competence protein ComEA
MIFQRKAAVKKRIIYRLAVVFTVLFSIALLPGCGGNNEIEIKLPPEQSASGGRIFITGSIDAPGYYPVEDTDSLRLVLRMAGGTLPEADLNQLRLYVPATGETKTPQKIDINRAEAWLLTALPGIGEVGAGRIVAYRAQNGPFRSVNDLTRVEGIGETTLSKIQNLVTIAE